MGLFSLAFCADQNASQEHFDTSGKTAAFMALGMTIPARHRESGLIPDRPARIPTHAVGHFPAMQADYRQKLALLLG
ncbi:hypothetical protein ACVOMS_05475 [Bradyrhizobium guangxiense]